MKYDFQRPAFCVFDNCKPVVGYELSKEDAMNGKSCFCMGENSVVETWVAGDTEHVNDLCFCIFTPFKGWQRYVMNEGDFESIGAMLKGFSKRTGREFRLYG